MPFKLTDKHITDYHKLGYTVFEAVIPDSLLGDLRRVTDKAREIAYEVTGRQAQQAVGDSSALGSWEEN